MRSVQQGAAGKADVAAVNAAVQAVPDYVTVVIPADDTKVAA